MELIAVPVRAAVLTDGPGAGGEFVVSHSASGLTRGLELDEQVVVVDPDGEFHAACVVDLEFSLEDTHYVMELGVRLPPDTVRARLAVGLLIAVFDVALESFSHGTPDDPELAELFTDHLRVVGELIT